MGAEIGGKWARTRKGGKEKGAQEKLRQEKEGQEKQGQEKRYYGEKGLEKNLQKKIGTGVPGAKE